MLCLAPRTCCRLCKITPLIEHTYMTCISKHGFVQGQSPRSTPSLHPKKRQAMRGDFHLPLPRRPSLYKLKYLIVKLTKSDYLSVKSEKASGITQAPTTIKTNHHQRILRARLRRPRSHLQAAHFTASVHVFQLLHCTHPPHPSITAFPSQQSSDWLSRNPTATFQDVRCSHWLLYAHLSIEGWEAHPFGFLSCNLPRCRRPE